MNANQFFTLADMPYGLFSIPEAQKFGLATLRFPCDPEVVGALVGKKWIRVKNLASEFQLAFPGFDIDVSYDGETFSVIVPNFDAGITFINESFGEEIAIANCGMEVRPEFVGRIIGAGGHNLRTIEDCIQQLEECKGCQCTVYHEDGRFWLRFPPLTPVEHRQVAMEFAKTRIYEHAEYLEDRLTDCDITSSECSSMDSVTTSEATSMTSSEYSDDGDWPELCA